MTDQELADLERLLAKATAGPWSVEDPLGPDSLSVIANGDGPAYEWRHIALLSTEPPEDNFDPSIIQQEANAALIAAMRNALPSLLAELRDLRGARERALEQAAKVAEANCHAVVHAACHGFLPSVKADIARRIRSLAPSGKGK